MARTLCSSPCLPPPPAPAGGLLGVQTLTGSFLVFFLSLLAKKCPRIMKKSIYSSDIQSGAFWNELAMGEFLSVFFFFSIHQMAELRWEQAVDWASRGPRRCRSIISSPARTP